MSPKGLTVSVDEDRFKRSHWVQDILYPIDRLCPSMRIVSSGVTILETRVCAERFVSVDEDRFKRSHKSTFFRVFFESSVRR